MATGQPESVVWCHCESCRRHSGAPVSVFVAFKRGAYVVTDGQITKFNSSPGRWRGFCAKFGSTFDLRKANARIKRIFISAHFVMLRNFSRRDTYSRRSVYPGYIWATLEVATSRRVRAPTHRPSRYGAGLPGTTRDVILPTFAA